MHRFRSVQLILKNGIYLLLCRPYRVILKGAIKDPTCGGNPVALNEDNLRELIATVV